MSNGPTPPGPGRWWWYLVIPLVAILVPISWWVTGWLSDWRPTANGFSRKPVTFVDVGIGLPEFFAAHYPGIEVRYVALQTPPAPFDIRVIDRSEAEAMHIVAALNEIRIELAENILSVHGKPMLEQHYDGVSQWLNREWHCRPWPNRW